MRPILKYRGGKAREIPNFVSFLPAAYDTYYEPFVGGGAVFFHLAPAKAVISDVNERLIQFYKELKDDPVGVRQQLDELRRLYEDNQRKYEYLKQLSPTERVENENEQLYYSMRDMFNRKTPYHYSEGVVYFFINKTAYSGMIRFNALGEYNVPFGRYKHIADTITEEHTELLRRTDIMLGDYSKSFEMATDKDFMFLDPPYDCTFHDYGNQQELDFGEEQHRKLAADFRNLSCKALMVIGKTALTEELYREYVKSEYMKSYAVNIRNRFKSEAVHMIITNY